MLQLNSSFTPTQIFTSADYPSYLFVQSLDGIYIFNTYEFESNFYLESTIPFNFSVVGYSAVVLSANSIIVVSLFNDSIWEYDVTNIKNPYFRKFYSTNFVNNSHSLALNTLVASENTNTFMLAATDNTNNVFVYNFQSGVSGNGNFLGLLPRSFKGTYSVIDIGMVTDYEGFGDIAFILTS
jgi:hypothetical protein